MNKNSDGTQENTKGKKLKKRMEKENTQQKRNRKTKHNRMSQRSVRPDLI